MAPLRVLVVVALVCAAARAGAEGSIGCEHGILRVGETQVDVLGKCGDPVLREVDEVESGVTVLDGRAIGVQNATSVGTVERWTFNFGPNRFVQVVTLHEGRVVRIESGGYGYPPEQLRAGRDQPCESSAIREGDRKLDVLAKCGEPTAREVRREQRVTSARGDVHGGTALGYVTVTIETWTYDLGPNRFIVIATLENGRVTVVDHGGYGYRSR